MDKYEFLLYKVVLSGTCPSDAGMKDDFYKSCLNGDFDPVKCRKCWDQSVTKAMEGSK